MTKPRPGALFSLERAQKKLNIVASEDQRAALESLIEHERVALDWQPRAGKSTFLQLAALALRGRALVIVPSAPIASASMIDLKRSALRVGFYQNSKNALRRKVCYITAEAFEYLTEEQIESFSLLAFDEVQTVESWLPFRPVLARILPKFCACSVRYKVVLGFSMDLSGLTCTFLQKYAFKFVQMKSYRPIISESIFLNYLPAASFSQGSIMAASLASSLKDSAPVNSQQNFAFFVGSPKSFPTIKHALKTEILQAQYFSGAMKNKGPRLDRLIRSPPVATVGTPILEIIPGLNFSHSFEFIGSKLATVSTIRRLSKTGQSALSLATWIDTEQNLKERGFLSTTCLRQYLGIGKSPCLMCSACLIREKVATLENLLGIIKNDIASKEHLYPRLIWTNESMIALINAFAPWLAVKDTEDEEKRLFNSLYKALGKRRGDKYAAYIVAIMKAIKPRQRTIRERAYILQCLGGYDFGL
mgnify:CR=1 FL=1